MIVEKSDIREYQSEFSVLTATISNLSGNVKDRQRQIYNRSFMDKYTLYDDFDTFLTHSPIKDLNDSNKINDSEELEVFVQNKTVFDSTEEMKNRAIEDWIVSDITI